MPQQQLGVLSHDSAGECVALVGPEVMTSLPSSAHEFLKVGARVDVLVIWREIVQDLRRRMDTSWCQTQIRLRGRVSVYWPGWPGSRSLDCDWVQQLAQRPPVYSQRALDGGFGAYLPAGRI